MVLESPPADWTKLNIDSSCRGNLRSCNGGGIIHDKKGNLLVAFSKHFRDGMNNGAKLQVLISGLHLYQDLGFF